MKKNLLLVFLISLQGFSQNYQSIRSTDVHYFARTDLKYVLGTRTDSVGINGTDSVFYSYHTLRQNDTLTTGGCSYLVGPNWYGEKVIIRNDGYNIFFNEDHDSIRINTQAVLNDTFLVYVYPGLADSVYGWISDHDTMTVLGIQDSVKSIELFSTGTWSLSDQTLLLSKSHGWVYWFAPYSFPQKYLGPRSDGYALSDYASGFMLVGQEYPRMGLTVPRRGDIFDYDIGDRFIITSGSSDYSGYSSDHYYLERDVVDTWTSPDTVFYTFHDTATHAASYFGSGTITYSGGLHTVYYTNLDDRLDTLLPEEYEFDNQGAWNYLGLNNCGRLQLSQYTESLSLYDWPASPCVMENGLSWGSQLYLSAVGLGQLPVQGWEWGYPVQYTSSLVYYAKAEGDTCGTNSYLSVEDLSGKQADFQVYPNPASEKIILQSASDLTESCIIYLVAMNGEVAGTYNASVSDLGGGFTISLDQLSPGIYHIRVTNREINSVIRFVKM